MRAYTICVDYSDILAKIAPLMRRHFDEWYVVTSSNDVDNVMPVVKSNDLKVIVTDLFYAYGAEFAKYAALEYALDEGGRDGWLCLLDADIVWSEKAKLCGCPCHSGLPFRHSRVCCDDQTTKLRRGKLYTPLRFMYPEVNRVPPESEWVKYPIHRNVSEWAGYTQIFHGSDPALGTAPWHDTRWRTAGGGDSFFQRKWKVEDKLRPDWHCLHLGPCGANWAGRATAYADGTVPPDADEKTDRLRDLIRKRGTVKGDHFFHEKV